MSNAGERYVQLSPLVRLLETPTRVKLLDVFLRKHYMPLTAEQLATYTDVNRTTVDRNIEVFLDLDMVEVADVDREAIHYTLNTDNETVQHFRNAQKSLLGVGEMSDEELESINQTTWRDVTPPTQRDAASEQLADDIPWADSGSNGNRVTGTVT